MQSIFQLILYEYRLRRGHRVDKCVAYGDTAVFVSDGRVDADHITRRVEITADTDAVAFINKIFRASAFALIRSSGACSPYRPIVGAIHLLGDLK